MTPGTPTMPRNRPQPLSGPFPFGGISARSASLSSDVRDQLEAERAEAVLREREYHASRAAAMTRLLWKVEPAPRPAPCGPARRR